MEGLPTQVAEKTAESSNVYIAPDDIDEDKSLKGRIPSFFHQYSFQFKAVVIASILLILAIAGNTITMSMIFLDSGECRLPLRPSTI